MKKPSNNRTILQNLAGILANLQNKLETRVQAEQQEVLLEPSPFWPSAITWVLAGGSLFGLAWLTFAQTEEVVVASGKLEPYGSVKDVQMPVQGVANKILVKEGERVTAGQVLIKLDTQSSTEKLKRNRESLQFKLQELALKENELLRSSTLAQRELNMLQKRLALSSDVMNRYQKLVEQGGVAQLQYLEQKGKVDETIGQIAMSNADDQRKQVITQQQIRELRRQIADLKAQISENEYILRYQAIRAPESGVVYDLKPKSPGFVAQGTEPILKIVPYELLKAKVEIPSSKIGFVAVGKPVDISIDSYPSVDFGVIHGVVKRIGSDVIPPEPAQNKPEYRYPADISMSTQWLRLKDGKRLPLQVGMSLTANIKLRKVSYLQLLIGGFQNKADSLRKL